MTSVNSLTPKLFTLLREGYSLETLRADALAGLTVAIVALPLAMALGVASGASPDKGLTTAIVAGLLISLLGGSRVQVGGPTGAFVVVVFHVIAAHGYGGLLLATLMAGLLLLAAGVARLGRLMRYIPHPVIIGFTSGIAVVIATSQVKDLLGLPIATPPVDFLSKWLAYARALPRLDPAATAVGGATMALLIGLRLWSPRLPGFLIAVTLAAAATWLLHLPVETIGARFPHMAIGLRAPAVPPLSLAAMRDVLPSAFTIAFLAGLEALLSATVADGMTGYRHRPNQELVAQGVANIASALFGGLPATGAIARTATNIRAGARTPVAGALHALFLLLFVLLTGDLMRLIPMAALAAVLLIVAWGMSDAATFLALSRTGGADRWVMALTFLLTLLADLTVAIGVGVVLASLLFMARMGEAVEIATGGTDEGEDAAQRSGLPPGVEVFRITGPLFYAVADGLLDTLRRIGGRPRALILRFELVSFLDASGIVALRALFRHCATREIAVIVSGARPDVLAAIRQRAASDSARYAADYAEALTLARYSGTASG